MRFFCQTCHQWHDELPDVGHQYPQPWLDATDAERAAGEWTPDHCRLDGEGFVRGVVEVPLHDYPRRFGFGAWVWLQPPDFATYLASPGSGYIGPFTGLLATRIDYYLPADTLQLPARLHPLGSGMRPRVELHPDDGHPLAVATRQGLTLAAALEVVHFYSPPLPRRPWWQWWQ